MIEIKSLSLQLGPFSLSDINLTVGDREYFVILGPTGAGKTILIECIAGLHRFRKGEIWVDGHNVTSLPPEKREIGYVPQDYALFPFLDVKENMIFGLREKDPPKKEIRERVESLAGLLGISHLLNRHVHTLSGGEKQRVALARAFAISPKILLLDEPLSSLDVRTSKYLRLELRRLHKALGVTTMHVTHDLMEAEEMADRIAILDMGRLEQVGTPDEVFFCPRTETVSDFMGTPNILDCEHYRTLGHGLMEAICGGIPVILPYQGNGVKKVALSPRDIQVSINRPTGPEVNYFRGVVAKIEPFSSLVRLGVKAGRNMLLTELPTDTFQSMDIRVGHEVFLVLKMRTLRVHC